MSVRLRFQRRGKPKQPYYRLVAIDKRRSRDGRALEVLGSYNPRLEKDPVQVDEARLVYWYRQGARPSDAVRTLLTRAGIWQKITRCDDGPKLDA